MRFSVKAAALWAVSLCLHGVRAVAPTDSYMDADAAQSGYLPNHNMDPGIVNSTQFGILWKNGYKGEQFYAKPLVFTPNGQSQLVFLASSANWIRTVDAKNGTLLNSRQVHTPFLQSDLNGCGDIPNFIGIIGTPVIDPQTEIAYFFSKTYISDLRVAGATGLQNGVYYFHGVDVKTLQDVPGYPILVDGSVAQNDPLQYFIGGVVLQRPSLVKVGNMVYGGFGGHCDKFNYTGAVIGVDTTQQKITTYFATMSGSLIKHTAADFTVNNGGGEGGVWQSGFGFSTDGNRIFLITGNGNAQENDGIPASGRSGCKTLGEAVINLGIADNGTLFLQDYFQPYDYKQMDGGDQDFGSSGLALLDPTVFNGAGVNKIGVTAGKNGRFYFLNVDNLGGYKMGVGQTDNVVWSISANKAVFGGAGSYPLEGGYVYLTPTGYPTQVLQMVKDNAGKPQFVQVGQSPETAAGRVGVGVPTTTSFKGKPGTGILWMTDPDKGIRAWSAVPGPDGNLVPITMPAIGGVVKFQRPAFGDTRLYTSDSTGNVYCLGSPVNLPLNCSTPVDFGDVALGSSVQRTVNCTALIALNNVVGATVLDKTWQVDNSTLPKGYVAKGASFSFPVTWNLAGASVGNTPNTSYGVVTPGIKSTPLTVYTANGVAGFANSVPLSLSGNQVSRKPFLITAPTAVDFGGLVLRGKTDPDPVSLAWTIKNAGLTNMTILGYAWTTDDLDDDDGPDFTNSTYSNGVWTLGDGFTSTNLPQIGSTVAPGQSIGVEIQFAPDNGVGQYFSYFNIWTNGGTSSTILEGSESTAPVANMSISTGEGGWLDITKDANPEMPYGNVLAGNSANRTIRICNNGGSLLKISKSKPPNGIFYITDDKELHEEQEIPIGECAYGTVIMGTVAERYNENDHFVENYWTLNTDDLTFDAHYIHITGTIVSQKVGPTNSTGKPVYYYLGCWNDNVNGRLLPKISYNGPNNTNGNCQATCQASGYVFAGTEYQQQCWCGNTPPAGQYKTDDSSCNFPCSGDGLDHCGGPFNSGQISIYYDASRYAPGDNSTFKPAGLPIDQQVGNYSYVGCYTEGNGGKALLTGAAAPPTNGTTVQNCLSRCSAYQYFGVEYSNECYCGNVISNNAALVNSNNPDANGCNAFCKGNSSQYCGGSSRLNVYKLNPVGSQSSSTTKISMATSLAYSTSSVATTSSTPTATSVMTSAMLSSAYGISSSISVRNSTSATYMSTGIVSSTSSIASLSSNSSSKSSTASTFSSASSASTSVIASSISTAFSTSAVPYTSTTITSSTSSTTTTALSITVPSSTIASSSTIVSTSTTASSSTRVSTSTTASSSATSLSASSSLPSSSSTATTSTSTLFSSTATTAAVPTSSTSSASLVVRTSTTLSSASSGLSSSSSTSTASSTTSSSPVSLVSSSSASTSATPTPTGPIIPQNISGIWSYQGCYTEASNGRALADLQNPIPAGNVTNEACAQACAKYTYFATEYSSECYCGYYLRDGSGPAAGGSDPSQNGCNFLCKANSLEYCGGSNRLSLYKSNVTAPVTNVTTVSDWTYAGCFKDNVNGRALAAKQRPIQGTEVSVENCAKACQGYNYFGVEYGSECYCDNVLGGNTTLATGNNPGETGCGMVCKANSTEYCGGPNRLNVYQVASNAGQKKKNGKRGGFLALDAFF